VVLNRLAGLLAPVKSGIGRLAGRATWSAVPKPHANPSNQLAASSELRSPPVPARLAFGELRSPPVPARLAFGELRSPLLTDGAKAVASFAGWWHNFFVPDSSPAAIYAGISGQPIAATVADVDRDRRRLRVIWVLQLAAGALVLMRLFVIQVVWYPRYSTMAKRQHVSAYKLPAIRGAIYDRNGRVLAVSQDGAAVYLMPRYFFANKTNVNAKLRDVCRLLGRSAAAVKAESKRKSFVWLKRPASPSELEQVRELCARQRIQGIGWEPLCLRHYPEGKTACQLLGFTNDTGHGLEGIEYGFDSVLYQDGGRMPVLRDNRGRTIFTGGGPVGEPGSGAASLTLTIDTTLQHAAERELEAGMARVGAKWGCAIVMDPITGELLALANAPRYVPGSFQSVPAYMRSNHAVTAVFEPGSTFKLVTLAAILQENLAAENDVFDCERGAYLLADEVLHDVEPYGKLTVAEIFAYSSNIGFAKLGQKLGHERMFRYARRFGFGELTGVGLPGEEHGLLKKTTDRFSLAAAAFGQGLGGTAIQIAASYAAIANKGVLVRPWVVREARDSQGRLRVSGKSQPVRVVVSPQVAKRLTEMLVGVVEYGTGVPARIKGYRVAGKTGTAQKSTSKGYAEGGEKIVTFVGFLPADAPRFLVLVTIDRPKWGTAGGVAGPVFREIALAALRQFGVPRVPAGSEAADSGLPEGAPRDPGAYQLLAGAGGFFTR
jgi:cell division protein FtsI (penicillin-binding protein 3)